MQRKETIILPAETWEIHVASVFHFTLHMLVIWSGENTSDRNSHPPCRLSRALKFNSHQSWWLTNHRSCSSSLKFSTGKLQCSLRMSVWGESSRDQSPPATGPPQTSSYISALEDWAGCRGRLPLTGPALELDSRAAGLPDRPWEAQHNGLND